MPIDQSTLTHEKMPQLRHFFIRHGDNRGPDLTVQGIAEARSLHRSLGRHGVALSTVRAFSADNSQSITSMALALDPEIPGTGLEMAANRMVKTGRIQLDRRLRYTKFGDNERQIASGYQAAYDRGTTMRFYVTESDKYLQTNPNLSTYCTIARSMAQMIIDRSLLDSNTINCGKQFLWPVLRARLFENRYGKAVRDEYVEWYCSSKELRDEARGDINTVNQERGAFVLEDAYGNFETAMADLKALIAGEKCG